MRLLPDRHSLSWKVFVALILGELAFATVLGITIGAFTAVSAAQQRQQTMAEVSATIAAGLMPTIADQQQPQVQAQLASILEASAVPEINAICLEDASGRDIACQGDWSRNPHTATIPKHPLDILLTEQVVSQPVVVDGLTVAYANVRFAPPGLSALKVPALATLVVLASVMVISVPWTAWRLVVELHEPLEELGAYASRIADGDLVAPAGRQLSGEIGDLQRALTRMAGQLQERRDAIVNSVAELQRANESLGRAKEEIEQLSEVKSNFVAVAAHEIRGPLTTISLYTELLESGESGEIDEQALEAVREIASATYRLTSIVSDLMDSSLLERGLMSVRIEGFGLQPLIEQSVENAQLVSRWREMLIGTDGEIPDISIRCDAGRLRQVLDNLLSNAIKYSPPNTRVLVTARVAGGWVEIDVADQGRGIPRGSEPKLFALFGRLDFGDSRDTAGLGLGLAISARIVEAHGGHLTYRENPEGVGSIFTVQLPLQGPDTDETTYQAVITDGGDDR